MQVPATIRSLSRQAFFDPPPGHAVRTTASLDPIAAQSQQQSTTHSLYNVPRSTRPPRTASQRWHLDLE